MTRGPDIENSPNITKRVTSTPTKNHQKVEDDRRPYMHNWLYLTFRALWPTLARELNLMMHLAKVMLQRKHAHPCNRYANATVQYNGRCEFKSDKQVSVLTVAWSRRTVVYKMLCDVPGIISGSGT